MFLHLLAILHLFLQLFHTCSVSCSLSAWSLFLFFLFVPARSAILILLFRYRTFRIFHRNFVMPVADVTKKLRKNKKAKMKTSKELFENNFLNENIFTRQLYQSKRLQRFLVGAFLKKRVDYSHGFSSVFFKTT